MAVLLVFAEQALSEVTCSTPEYQCQEWSTKVVLKGVPLARHCVRSTGSQTCVDDKPTNECSALAVSGKCKELSKTCVDHRNGKCRQWRFRYSCLNENGNMSPAILAKTVFGDVQEKIISTCDALQDDQKCELSETRDVEGEEIRNINRREFSRSWWKRKRFYSCVAPGEGSNNCGPLESDPTCKLKSDQCLARLDGVCTNRQYHYICGENPGTLKTSCAPINVCVGKTCIGTKQEPSSSFGDSAAWLNILQEMQTRLSQTERQRR